MNDMYSRGSPCQFSGRKLSIELPPPPQSVHLERRRGHGGGRENMHQAHPCALGAWQCGEWDIRAVAARVTVQYLFMLQKCYSTSNNSITYLSVTLANKINLQAFFHAISGHRLGTCRECRAEGPPFFLGVGGPWALGSAAHAH